MFDGSGGFPLAGAMNDVRPVWASEIEPYPLRVTAARFPQMKQLGDVTKIDGTQIEPVNIITFGSPCQDLSVAGKQVGIHEGERSNLFFEAIRIIKEMRQKTNGEYPRFALWENVPGAFSSGKGEDFRAVLAQFVEIGEGKPVSISRPKKWSNAGCIVGNGYSVAWRVYDAQYWGVPQRRKRIYLIADFGGERAGEILFERTSGAGNNQQGEEAWKGTAVNFEGSAGGSGGVKCLNPWDSQTIRQYEASGVFPTLQANSNGGQCRQGVVISLDCRNISGVVELSGTLQAKSNGGHSLNYINPIVYDARGNGDGKTVSTLTGDHNNRITDYTTCVTFAQERIGQYKESDKASCMMARDYKSAKDLICETKSSRKYIVRRLTPLECCRLQGFPDFWEDGVSGSDSARYKLWGNGIALPCAYDVLNKIANELRK